MSMVSSVSASYSCSPTHLVFSTKNTLMPNTASDRDNPLSTAKRVAVIGAGVSGLAAAYRLKSNGLSVTLLEADERAGGKIRTVANNGFIWDEGANTMTESEVEVTRLINDLGLRDKQQSPLSQNKRYIARDGLPVLLPSDPVSLLSSNILSAKSKLQILLEPFSWKKRHNLKGYNEQAEESVGEFFSRHFGEELVDYLIDPFVAGTSGGDPQSLSMRHTFPELWDIENRYGSILCGAVQSRLTPKKKQSVENKSSDEKRVRGSFSFKGGMQTLIDTICERLSKDELKLQCKVLSLSHCHEGQSNSWSLSCLSSKTIEEKLYDAVVVTAPLCNVKEMKILTGGSPFNLDFIPEVNYLPVSIVVTAFKKKNVKRPLEGFGVLIPSKEQGLKTLGTLFSSMMFPDRAPSDQYLYTTFVGGSRNRQLAKASMAELKELVSSELHQLLGTEGEPSFMNLTYWSKAFPLYGLDYGSVKKAIEKMENDLPGFFYAGNHKDGLSVGKALASGYKAADLVTSYLDSKSNVNQTH